MIAAEEFARAYRSFWSSATPFSEPYVRDLNEHLAAGPTWEMVTRPDRRALIAETAFELFRRLVVEDEDPFRPLTPLERAEAFLAAQLHVGGLAGVRGGDLSEPDAAEWSDAETLAYGIVDLLGLAVPAGAVTVSPVFPGCGIVDAAEGDVLVGRTLYEIKSVDRPFRSADIHQLLVYAALQRAAGAAPQIVRLGLVNPRSMVAVAMDADDVSLAVAGRALADLLETIIDAMAATEVSR